MSYELRKKLKPFAFVHWVANSGMWHPKISMDEYPIPKHTGSTENLYSEEVVHSMYEALEVIINTAEAGYSLSSSDLRMAKKALKKARGDS